MCLSCWIDVIRYADKEKERPQGTNNSYLALASRSVKYMLHVVKTLVS